MRDLKYSMTAFSLILSFVLFISFAHSADRQIPLKTEAGSSPARAPVKPATTQPIAPNVSQPTTGATQIPLSISSSFKIAPSVSQKANSILHSLASPLTTLESSYNKVKQAWISYESAYNALKSRVAQCSDPNKPFTAAEQQKAGCVNSDTLEECSLKLLQICIWDDLYNANDKFLKFETELDGVENTAFQIGCNQYKNLALIPLQKDFQWYAISSPLPLVYDACHPKTLQ